MRLLLLLLALVFGKACSLEWALEEWTCGAGAVCEIRNNCAVDGGRCLAMTSFGNASALLSSPLVPGAVPLSTWLVSVSLKCALLSGSAYIRLNDASLGKTSLTTPTDIGGGWQRYEFLTAISNSADAVPKLNVGQYFVSGTCLYSSLSVSPAEIRETSFASYGPLGRRERVINNGSYIAEFGGSSGSSNFHRSLVFFNTSWNGDCFRFWRNLCVEFNHKLDVAFLSAPNVTISTNYFVPGIALRVWASANDGGSWDVVEDNVEGIVTGLQIRLPTVAHTRVRLCSNGSTTGAIYVNKYEFRSTVVVPHEIILGDEVVLAVTASPLPTTARNFSISLDAVEGMPSHQDKQTNSLLSLPLYLRSRPSSTQTISATFSITPRYVPSEMSFSTVDGITVAPGAVVSNTLRYHLAGGVPQCADVVVKDASIELFSARLLFWPMHALLDTAYGELLASSSTSTLWWADSLRKISKFRSVPTVAGIAKIRLEAARNEREAFQIVVSAKSTDVLVSKVEVSDLVAVADGSVIDSAKDVTVRTVGYVFTYEATDVLGLAGAWWPDPLLPLDLPFNCPANTNCPFWVLVHVPQTSVAGNHTGTVKVTAGVSSFTANINLHVYNFSIPRHTKLKSWFGLSQSTMWKYHNLTSASTAVKEQQWDLYLKSCEEHRMSPSSPMAFHSPTGRLTAPNGIDQWTFSFSDFEQNYQRYYSDDGMGFTFFPVSLRGMGGGNYHSRTNGTIRGVGGLYPWGSANHTRLFNEYAIAIQDLLLRTGMNSRSFIYWFDEPLPADYDFVIDGMQKIHAAAPQIRRFLTEKPVPELFGHIDVWCPKQDVVDVTVTSSRQHAGEEVWSYLSGFPRTGRLDMFIDRPAAGLRLWLWLIYQQSIEGFLIWSTTTWTSTERYNNTLQDPYEDPMSWSSEPPLHNWGNGDGRLHYPPVNWKSATGPIANITPVESMRWEHLRDGVEDWDTMTVLQELIDSRPLMPAALREEAETLLIIPETLLSGGGTGYAMEPTELFARRRSLFQMIETITVTPDNLASSEDAIDVASLATLCRSLLLVVLLCFWAVTQSV